MESEHNYQKRLQWINKAIEVKEEVTWWDLRVKAILLMELGEYATSKKLAMNGLEMAQKVKKE